MKKHHLSQFTKDLDKMIHILSKEDRLIAHLKDNNVGKFQYIGVGSSRIVYRDGSYVYKVALNPAGQLQNKAEFRINNELKDDDLLSKTFTSETLYGLENFINISEYNQPVYDYIYNLLLNTAKVIYKNDELFLSHLKAEKLICLIDYIMDNNIQNSNESFIREFLEGYKEYLEEKLEFYEFYSFNPADFEDSLNFTLGTIDDEIINHKFSYCFELRIGNFGVKQDKKGNFILKKIIDYGFDRDVQLEYDTNFGTFRLNCFNSSNLINKPQ